MQAMVKRSYSLVDPRITARRHFDFEGIHLSRMVALSHFAVLSCRRQTLQLLSEGLTGRV